MAQRSRSPRAILLLITLAAGAAGGPWWPRTSRHPVVPLDHPTIESRAGLMRPDPRSGFQFVAFGDQRALVRDDWPALIGVIDTLASRHDRLLFLVDTGDIVDDGTFSDQFHMLEGLMGRIVRLPYLVAVGNHEVNENRRGSARANTATFLSSIGEPLSAERLYYRKVVGGVRFVFLDSNDLVYQEGGDIDEVAVGRRAHAQMEWLTRELADPAFGPDATTIVVMHHPLIQSSAKHRGQASELWDYRFHGRRLADILADGGVDLVLTGHTHTYERFRVVRRDGRGFHLINLSGKPEPWFLWFGDGARRGHDLRGNEEASLYTKGWSGLSGWSIAQEEVMADDEVDQCGLFTVDADGGVTLSISFLGRSSAEPPVRLLWGARTGKPDSLRLERKK